MYSNFLLHISTDPNMASLKDALFQEIAAEFEPKSNNKVTIVGIGAVGMAAAFSILAQVKKIQNIIYSLKKI